MINQWHAKLPVHNKTENLQRNEINAAPHYYKLTVVVSLSQSICKIQYTL